MNVQPVLILPNKVVHVHTLRCAHVTKRLTREPLGHESRSFDLPSTPLQLLLSLPDHVHVQLGGTDDKREEDVGIEDVQR